jgi:putative SOS response-associated peptidase YedK
MCNLYSMTSTQDAIRQLTQYFGTTIGNLKPSPAIFANGFGPIVRNTSEGRELAQCRWGMPSHPFTLKGRNYDSGVTNCREPEKKHWQQWMHVANRAVVPVTSFCEPNHLTKENTWFALNEDRPLFFFAGLWTPQWTSVRKVKEGLSTHDLYAFLTTEANEEVKQIHPKAMPVILRTADEIDTWMRAPFAEARALQKPLPDATLHIVNHATKLDYPAGMVFEDDDAKGRTAPSPLQNSHHAAVLK